MAGFDSTKDVELRAWQMFGEDSDTNLFASVNQYNKGVKKFQIGPRTSVNRKGETKFNKVGRMTLEEVQWIADIISEVVEVLADPSIDSAKE